MCSCVLIIALIVLVEIRRKQPARARLLRQRQHYSQTQQNPSAKTDTGQIFIDFDRYAQAQVALCATNGALRAGGARAEAAAAIAAACTRGISVHRLWSTAVFMLAYRSDCRAAASPSRQAPRPILRLLLLHRLHFRPRRLPHSA